jgi:hypothetical protein
MLPFKPLKLRFPPNTTHKSSRRLWPVVRDQRPSNKIKKPGQWLKIQVYSGRCTMMTVKSYTCWQLACFIQGCAGRRYFERTWDVIQAVCSSSKGVGRVGESTRGSGESRHIKSKPRTQGSSHRCITEYFTSSPEFNGRRCAADADKGSDAHRGISGSYRRLSSRSCRGRS